MDRWAYVKVQVGKWGPSWIMMGIIFLFSALPASKLPSFSGWLEIVVKKGGHFLAYAVLANLYLRGLNVRQPGSITIAWGMSTLYAVSDEFHQNFVPGRRASTMDVGIDALGALIGLLFYIIVGQIFRSSQNEEIHPLNFRDGC